MMAGRAVNRRSFLGGSAAAFLGRLHAAAQRSGFVLDAEAFRHHVDFFNGMVKEEVINFIPDSEAWPWMKSNVPLFTCPDAGVDLI